MENLEVSVRKLIDSVFSEWGYEANEDFIENLTKTLTAYSRKAATASLEYGLEIGDFLTPIWQGLTDAFMSYGIEKTTVACFLRCIKNRIYDVCRSSMSKKHIPLNNGMKTILAGVSKSKNNYEQSSDQEMDVFDAQTKSIANLSFDENEYYGLTMDFVNEALYEIKDQDERNVIIGWFSGVKNYELSNITGFQAKKVSKIVKDFLGATKRKVLNYLENSDLSN